MFRLTENGAPLTRQTLVLVDSVYQTILRNPGLYLRGHRPRRKPSGNEAPSCPGGGWHAFTLIELLVVISTWADGHGEGVRVSKIGFQYYPGIAPDGSPAKGDTIIGVGNGKYDPRWLWDRE